MSRDEEVAERGLLTTEYMVCKQQLVLLSRQVGRISQGLIDLGKMLQSSRKFELTPEQTEILNAERLSVLVADLNQTRQKVLELKEQLRQLGIDVV